MKPLLLFAIMLAVSGCSHVYKHYDYDTGVTSAHDGKVTIVLNGHHTAVSESPPITKVGSPYCTVVYWQSEDLTLEGKDIETHIALLSQKSGLRISIDKIDVGKIKTPNKRFHPDSEDKIYFNAAACDLVIEKHEPVTIEGTIIIDGKPQKFKATLEPNYWQERRNDTFDAMMSV